MQSVDQCYAASSLLQAQCVAADPAGVGTTGAQSTACVYGYARSACWRGETDHRLLIDYNKTNIDYEKKTSLTSLILTVT